MVQKTTKHRSLDDLDIDHGLDLPDFDFEAFDKQFDKKKKTDGPIMDVTSNFVKGVGSSIFKIDLIEDTLRKTLPSEYSSAIDLGQKSLGSARSLYNLAVRELRPAVQQLKQTTQQILPKTEGILPKQIQEYMREWSKRNESSGGISEERMREQAIAIELGQLFNAQAEDTDRRDVASRRREQVRETIEQFRHRDSMGRMSEMADSLAQIAAYNDQVRTPVARKSLELQIRQYQVMSDLLRETKIGNSQRRAQLEAVVHNTGLPDFSKLSTAKAFKQNVRNKFLDAGQNALFGRGSDFLSKYIDNIQNDLSEKIKGGAGDANMLTTALDAMVSFASIEQGGEKKSTKGSIANFLGSLVGDSGVGMVQDKIKEHLGKDSRIQKGADWIGYADSNAGPLVRDLLTDPANKLKLPDFARDYLLKLMPQIGVESKVDVGGLNDAKQPAIFNNASQKSLIEVIPGLLARILREQTMARTGQDAPLITYDYKANKFSTQTKIAQGVREAFISKQNVADVGDRFKELFDRIDPDQKLSDKDRDLIRKDFLTRGVKGEGSDAKVLTNKNTWEGSDDPRAIAKFFQNYLRTNSIGQRDGSAEGINRQRLLSDDIARLTRFFGDPRARIQEMARLGQLDAIQQSGLYKRDSNEFDFDKIIQGLLGEDVQYGNAAGDEDFIPMSASQLVRPGATQTPSFMPDAGATRIRRKTQVDPRLMQQRRAQAAQAAAQRARLRRQQSTAIRPEEVSAPASTPPVAAEALAQTVKVDFNVDSMQKLIQEQAKQNDTTDVNANLLTIIDVMQSVDKRLEEGINTYSLTEDLLGPEARKRFGDRIKGLRERAGDAATAAKEKIKSWDPRNITLGDIMQGGINLGKTGLKWAGKVAGTIPGVAKGLFGAARSVAGTVGGIAGAVTQKAVDIFGDLYVKGESEPRLRYVILKQGKYIDKNSGKPLTSFKDIKGPVTNEDGSQTLLSQEELENTYIRGKKITALKEIVGGAIDWSGKIARTSTKLLGGFYGGLFNLAIKGGKAAIKLLPPYDVFVKGEEDPRLTAGGFRAGMYFSKKTGKQLNHPRDIDGPVVNEDGNQTFISEEDFKIGLVDKNGLTVTNKVARLFGKVAGFAKMGVKALKGIASLGKEFLVGIGQAVKDIFSGVFGLRGEYLETAMSQLDVQKKIFELLNERLPKNKNVRGDADGDGIRDGSAEEIRKKLAEDDAKKAEVRDNEKNGGKEKNGGGKGLLASLAGMFGKGKKKDGGEEGEDGDTTIVGGLGGAAKGAEKGAGKAADVVKNKNWWGKGGKLARGAGALGRGLWGATKFAGSAALSLAGLTGLGLGGLVTGAGSAIAGVAGAVGTGLAAAATGIGAILASPVVLTALGIAAVAGAGYLAYKYLTKAGLTPLNKVRFAQYGFGEVDKNRLSTIFELENKLLPRVKFEGEKALLQTNGLDFGDLMKPFGMSYNSDNAPKWVNWFQSRFKPVFLGSLAALRAIDPKIKLEEADSKLKAEDKIKFLNAAAMPNGPYDRLDSPFADMKQLSVSSSGVAAAVELARDQLSKDLKEGKGKDAAKAAGVATAGAAAVKLKDPTAPGNGEDSAVRPKFLTDADALKAAAGVGAAGAVADSGTSVSVGGKGNVPADFIFTGQKGQIDSFTAIRLKAYGLVEMDVAKIRDLMWLEQRISKMVTFNKDGAVYDEDVQDLLAIVGPKFGIPGPQSQEGLDWIHWFRSRFLPIFLNYRTLLKKATGKDDYVKGEMVLTPQQQLDVGNAIIATTGVYKRSRVPIWDIPLSPWPNYAVNTDSDTTKMNVDFLVQAIKAVKAGEQKTDAKRQQQANDMKAAIKDGKAVDPMVKSETAGGAAVVYRKESGTLNRERQAMAAKDGFVQSATLQSNGQGVRAIGDYTGGTEVKHPGNGSGGDINSLPMPTSNDWNGMKAMYSAVAKMTGMDIGTLAAITAIESGFNPNARPMTKRGELLSSATGLFQFTAGTWADMMKKYGAKYGIAPNTPPTDPRANALLGAEFTKQNIAYLKSKLKKNITHTDVYMAHFLGAGGASQFLNSDPSSIGEQVMPDAAKSNPFIFRDKNTGQPRTFGEIYKLFNLKMDRETAKFGVSDVTGQDYNPEKKDTKTPNQAASAETPAKPNAANAPTDAAKPAAQQQAGYASAANKPSTGSQALAATAATPAPVSAQATKAPEAPAPAAPSGGAYAPRGPQAVVAPAAPAPVPAPQQAPIRPPADFYGFQSRPQPSGRELNAQADAQRQAMATNIETIGKTLQDQLSIQTALLKEFQDFRKERVAADKQRTTAAAPVTGNDRPAANTATVSSVTKQAPEPAVSMARKY